MNLRSLIVNISSSINKKGVTLVEMLTAVAVLGVLVVAIGNVFLAQMRSSKMEGAIRQRNQESLSTMDGMMSVMRRICRCDQILVADPDRFVFGVGKGRGCVVDTAASALIPPAGVLGFRHNPSADTLNDADLNIEVFECPGSPCIDQVGNNLAWRYYKGQPPGAGKLTTQVTGLAFRYYNIVNEEYTAGGFDDKTKIRTVEIILDTRIRNPNPGMAEDIREKTLRVTVRPPCAIME